YLPPAADFGTNSGIALPPVGSTAARRIARERWRVCYAPHTGVLEPSDLRRGEGKRQVAAAARSRIAANPGCRGIAKFLASRALATPFPGAYGCVSHATSRDRRRGAA